MRTRSGPLSPSALAHSPQSDAEKAGEKERETGGRLVTSLVRNGDGGGREPDAWNTKWQGPVFAAAITPASHQKDNNILLQ